MPTETHEAHRCVHGCWQRGHQCRRRETAPPQRYQRLRPPNRTVVEPRQGDGTLRPMSLEGGLRTLEGNGPPGALTGPVAWTHDRPAVAVPPAVENLADGHRGAGMGARAVVEVVELCLDEHGKVG